MVIVTRKDGSESLRDQDKKVMLFPTQATAEEYLVSFGVPRSHLANYQYPEWRHSHVRKREHSNTAKQALPF